MIKSKMIANFKILNRNLKKTKKIGEISSPKMLKKSNFKKSASATLPILLIGCNNATVTEDLCEDYDTSTNVICLDTLITGTSANSSTVPIEMPSEAIPVAGTSTADTFIANSGFLTSKTIIDGGEGSDTLNLNLIIFMNYKKI